MAGNIYVSQEFKDAFSQLQLQKRVIVSEKIVKLFCDSRHPSLNAHRLRRPLNHIWECYIDRGMRLLYQRRKEGLFLWALGSHALLENVRQRRFHATAHFTPWSYNPVVCTSSVYPLRLVAEF